MKVLLVDDEAELVSTLAERLSLRDIHADWVTNAEAALQQAKTGDYDIALIDVKLPKMSGIELKRKLQQVRPGMKFIFMTGHGSEADYRRGAAEAGAEYYLPKPMNIHILIDKMKEIMSKEDK